MFFFRKKKDDKDKKKKTYEDSLFRTNIDILTRNVDLNRDYKEKENYIIFYKK